jgi:acyl-CoA thioester hydrolase
MEHMNVMWYVGKFDEATWQLLARMGLSPSYLRQQKRGMVAVEQQISYRHELRPGAVVAVYSTVLEVRAKVVRFRHEMHNEESREVAATTELTGVHLDTETRKSCAFPVEILERLRAAAS